MVAREEETIVGVAEVLVKPTLERDGIVPRVVALIDIVVVRASHRGRGIGSTLVARAEEWARDHGASACELQVWTFNEDARRLYERLGYATRAVRMERSLTSASPPLPASPPSRRRRS